MTEPPGLQPERTDLAWRRTLLALAVGSLVSLRVLPPVLGAWSIAPGLGGVVLCAGLWVAAGHRSRRAAAAFAGTRQPPGAALLAITAVVAASGAALGLAFVVGGVLRPR